MMRFARFLVLNLAGLGVAGWMQASQPRRLPRARKAGGAAWSSTGAQTNFRE